MLEVVCELEGVSESKDRTLDPVDASYRFLGVPGGAYLPVGVTSIEETTQAGLTPVADPLMKRRLGGGVSDTAGHPCGLDARGFRFGLFVVPRRDAGWPGG